MIGTHFQQDFDTARLTEEVAPYSGTVMQPTHIENITNLAVRYALTNRGVPHIGIPIDMQLLQCLRAGGHLRISLITRLQTGLFHL